VCVCVRVQRDLLFIYDKDAVVLGGDAGHRVLTGHLSLIVTAERERGGDKKDKDKERRELESLHRHHDRSDTSNAQRAAILTVVLLI